MPYKSGSGRWLARVSAPNPSGILKPALAKVLTNALTKAFTGCIPHRVRRARSRALTRASTSAAAFCAAALVALLPAATHAQSFTRITDGPHVNDLGASRSVNWIDYDADGDLDLFVTNGHEDGEPAFLYRNDGAPNWTFTKVTDDPIVQDLAKADGASFGDVDNDGDLDAMIVTWYGDLNLFYLGDGAGGFVKNTTEPQANIGTYSETCSWGDYDGDGWLDLYVANSGQSGLVPNLLYHNDGAGSFTQVDVPNVTTDPRTTRGVNWVDYDGDGDQDLFVVNESNQLQNLYRNEGDGTFTPVTGDPIVSTAGSSWTASWADIDNDGDLDAYVGNWGNQNDFLFLNDGDGTFTRNTTDILVTSGGFEACSGWGDYDNDGDLDLFTTNSYGGAAKTNRLFTNQLRETGTLSFVRAEDIPLVTDLGYTYGFAWGDYDRDGDLDIFQARTFGESENNALYRNDESNGNHWLTLQLVGTESNHSGIGAEVRAVANLGDGVVTQVRVVEGQSGYCGQNLELHFGLGTATTVDELWIDWPSGTVDRFTAVSVDQHLVLTEGQTASSVEPGSGGDSDTGSDSDSDSGDLWNDSHHPWGIDQAVARPNPFDFATDLSFSLHEESWVTLDVFDLAGRLVSRLANEPLARGLHSRRFLPPSESAAGVYFYRYVRSGHVSGGKLLYKP